MARVAKTGTGSKKTGTGGKRKTGTGRKNKGYTMEKNIKSKHRKAVTCKHRYKAYAGKEDKYAESIQQYPHSTICKRKVNRILCKGHNSKNCTVK